MFKIVALVWKELTKTQNKVQIIQSVAIIVPKTVFPVIILHLVINVKHHLHGMLLLANAANL